AGSLEVLNGARVSTRTMGAGNAGNIEVTASSICLDGKLADRLTGLASRADGGTGKGGDIVINADSVEMTDGARILAFSQTDGASGRINIMAQSVALTELACIDDISLAGGPGGRIDVATGSLSLKSGGLIETLALGAGRAGDVTIQANDT